MMGKNEEALQLMNQLYEHHPTNQAIILHYADLLFATDQFRSLEQLISNNKEHLDDPIIHQLLAQVYGKQKKTTELHQAQAEWYFARGEYKAAIKQLDIAQESTQRHGTVFNAIQKRKASMKKMFDMSHKLG